MKTLALSIGGWFKEAGKAVGLFLLAWLVVMIIVLTFLTSILVGLLGFGHGFMGYALSLTIASAILTILPCLYLAITGGDIGEGYIIAYLVGGFVGGAAVSLVFVPFGMVQRFAAEFGRQFLPFMTPEWVAVLILGVALISAFTAVGWLGLTERQQKKAQQEALAYRQYQL